MVECMLSVHEILGPIPSASISNNNKIITQPKNPSVTKVHKVTTSVTHMGPHYIYCAHYRCYCIRFCDSRCHVRLQSTPPCACPSCVRIPLGSLCVLAVVLQNSNVSGHLLSTCLVPSSSQYFRALSLASAPLDS